jgi:heptosyltransferase I
LPPANEQLRVLIVRLGAMGDILHAMPAVSSLRQAHPQWFLGWAVEPRWLALLRGSGGEMPLVNRTHVVAAKEWSRSPLSLKTFTQIRAMRTELRGEHYDVCVDLQGAVRSAWLARAAGAPRLLGEDQPREWVARWLFRERIPATGTHVIEQAIEVCEAILGEKLDPALPLLPVAARAEAWAEELLSAAESRGEDRQRMRTRPAVLLSPGAGWGAKRWPADRYGTVAAELSEAGYRVLVNAAPHEQEIAVEVVAASGGAAQAPEFTLERLISVTRRASLVIAGDTGPLHLACALGKPVVGIFGPTDPTRNGPFGVPFRVLRHPASKRDHARRSAPEAGLLTIAPEQVVAAALDLLPRPEQFRENA